MRAQTRGLPGEKGDTELPVTLTGLSLGFLSALIWRNVTESSSVPCRPG